MYATLSHASFDPPRTTWSWFTKSSYALRAFRNSGLKTMSSMPPPLYIACSDSGVHGGIVDLMTSVRFESISWARMHASTSATTDSMMDVSHDPSSFMGVGTHAKMNGHSSTMPATSIVERSWTYLSYVSTSIPQTSRNAFATAPPTNP